jgi:hypothetical protein
MYYFSREYETPLYSALLSVLPYYPESICCHNLYYRIIQTVYCCHNLYYRITQIIYCCHLYCRIIQRVYYCHNLSLSFSSTLVRSLLEWDELRASCIRISTRHMSENTELNLIKFYVMRLHRKFPSEFNFGSY